VVVGLPTWPFFRRAIGFWAKHTRSRDRYVLVSMGVIIACLLAALATGWFIDRLCARRSRQTVPGGKNAERGRTDQVPPG